MVWSSLVNLLFYVSCLNSPALPPNIPCPSVSPALGRLAVELERDGTSSYVYQS